MRFVGIEISAMLAFLHSKKVLYRDLQPNHLVLDMHGHLRLMDFGHALQGEEAIPSSETAVQGHECYMAPEVKACLPPPPEIVDKPDAEAAGGGAADLLGAMAAKLTLEDTALGSARKGGAAEPSIKAKGLAAVALAGAKDKGRAGASSRKAPPSSRGGAAPSRDGTAKGAGSSETALPSAVVLAAPSAAPSAATEPSAAADADAASMDAEVAPAVAPTGDSDTPSKLRPLCGDALSDAAKKGAGASGGASADKGNTSRRMSLQRWQSAGKIVAAAAKELKPAFVAEKTYSHPADWFALGVILYELTEQKLPFGEHPKYAYQDMEYRNPKLADEKGRPEWVHEHPNQLPAWRFAARSASLDGAVSLLACNHPRLPPPLLPCASSPDLNSILLWLLEWLPAKRLGQGADGWQRVKSHKYWAGPDWVLVDLKKVLCPLPCDDRALRSPL